MSRLYSETHKEGKRNQRLLHKPLEKYFREELIETPEEDSFDFEGLTFWLELKSRHERYRSDDKYADQGWWVGVPKLTACKKSQREVYFIYYFPSDGTVWLLKYDEKLFSSFKPFPNAQGQPTIAIPKTFWRRIELDL